MKHIFALGSHQSEAWFGPTRPRPFRYPVCVIDSTEPEHIEFAAHMTDEAARQYDRKGVVFRGFESYEDGLSPEEFDRREREAERAEWLRTSGALS